MGLISASVCAWLVRDQQGWTLVDSGPPSTTDLLVSALARATEGKGPSRILLTHGHYDHGGGLAAVRMAWNPPIVCHKDEVPFITGENDYRNVKASSFLYLVSRYFLPKTDWGLPVARDLERGEAAAGMAVIHLPGHSAGQIGFLHPQDQAMICGDAVMNLNGRLSPPMSLATPDPKLAKASMRRLGELDFEHLLPSHGEPILGQGRETMLRFLEKRGLDVDA